jgi:hypothetical protein
VFCCVAPPPFPCLTDVPIKTGSTSDSRYNPMYQSACTIPSASLPPDLAETVDTLFPETKTPDRALVRPDIFVYFTADRTNLSFTYVSSISGGINLMGYATYNTQTKVIGTRRPVFPRTNQLNGPACLVIGDTFKFGMFNNGDQIVFYLQQGSNRFWSYLDPPTLTNPSGSCVDGNPCKHSAWAYLPNQDITVYGMEDYSFGDWDYNDLVFFLQIEGNATYNEVPPYEDGTIRVCNAQSGASSQSLATVNCTQWALLESTTATQSCLTYMPIPAGWIWAPNEPASIAVITTLAAKWSYTSATCFLLSTTATTGVGYRSNGAPCTGGEYEIKTIVNGTKICYNAKCTSRFVLKGADLGTACSAANRCSDDNVGQVLAFEPTSPVGSTIWPTASSVYLKVGTGTIGVTTTLQLPGGTPTDQDIDIVVLADLSTVPSDAVASVQSSWNSIVSGFTSEKLAGARFTFVQYIPNGGSYQLLGSYQFSKTPAALSASIFPSPVQTCTAAGSRPMYKAVAEVMNNTAIAWSPTAFKVIWVHSACDFDITNALASTSKQTGVVPVFAYAGVSSGTTVPGSGYAPTGNALPPIFKAYKSNTATGSSSGLWSSPFSYAGSTNAYPRGAGLMRYYPTTLLAFPIEGDLSFVKDLPTAVNIDARTAGQGTILYKIAWPSGYAAVATYQPRVTVRIMGRGTVTYTINFNRAPVLPDVTYTFAGNVNQTIALSPTDADGNTLNVVVNNPFPTRGKLYNSVGSQITAINQLPAGAYTLLYVPNQFAVGTDTVYFTVSDGCLTDPGTATLTIQYANNAPVARDILVTMIEDSTAVGSNGLIDFSTYISDIDNTSGGQTQALSILMTSAPTPNNKGSLVNEDDQAAANVGSVDKLLRFKLNQPFSGWGNVTFTYRASDSIGALSNIATVTVQILHKNHEPFLTISNTHLIMSSANPADTMINGYISDIDYEVDTINLYVVAETLTNSAVKTPSAQYNNGDPMPFRLYASGNISSSSSSFTLSNLIWPSNTVAGTETVTLRAQDSVGAWSNAVIVTLQVLAANPPYWSIRPVNGSTVPVAYAALEMVQGNVLSGLAFAAKDADGTQWQDLVFSLTTSPSNGVIRLHPWVGGTSVAFPVFPFSSVTNTTFVGRDNTNMASYFYVEYTPNPSFYGTDTFTFNVKDSAGYSAAEPATVTVNVARRPTNPISSDIEIRTLEQVPGIGQIPASSTNGASIPVHLELLSVDFFGTLKFANGTTWEVGTHSVESTDTFVEVVATGLLGVFAGPSTRVGYFTYAIHENTNGLSGTTSYTGSIFITHVNHAPTSDNQNDVIPKRSLLKVTLKAQDIDSDDTPDTIQARLTSIAVSSKGQFFLNADMSTELTSSNINTVLTSRTFWYRSMTDVSVMNQPLAIYTFVVIDSHGAVSLSTYQGTITVDWAGDAPTSSISDVYTYQETPVPMALALGVITETGVSPIVTITSLPQKGTFSICDDNGVCVIQIIFPVIVSSSVGRVVYIPEDDNWGSPFTSFTYNLTDAVHGATSTNTMRIHVYHVNKRPQIAAANFLTTAQTSGGIIVNESSSHSFDWRVWDVDSLPNTLTTSLRVNFYTTLGFSLYQCTFSGAGWNTTECSFDTTSAVPFAIRTDFTKNARKSISAYQTVNDDCIDADVLKARKGVTSRNCEAHFKFAFVPAPFAAYTPYITIFFTGVDDQGAESSPISALIYVKSVNSAPTIWSPSTVLAAQGVTNPFIRDTDQSTATYNRPVQVADVDANGNVELLTISVVEGSSGKLIWPNSAPCEADASVANTWRCRDSMPGFRNWLKDLRFEVEGDRADIKFEINDLGFSSDYRPSPNLTATSFTSIVLTGAVVQPKGNSSTLAIAVGVAAAAGLLLLGALGFFLRRAVAPPTDDYFSAATTPLSAAPQSPLYQAQNHTHENALYKARS